MSEMTNNLHVQRRINHETSFLIENSQFTRRLAEIKPRVGHFECKVFINYTAYSSGSWLKDYKSEKKKNSVQLFQKTAALEGKNYPYF